MPEDNILLHPEQIFHVYNHAVGKENLFDRPEDFVYFLSKIKEHLLPVSNIIAYCLLPNHYHLVLRFKETETVKDFFRQKIKSKFSLEQLMVQDEKFLSKQLSQAASNCFNSYAKHFNFVKGRTGTLFKRTFRRKIIDDPGYLKTLICYIHQNPVAAKFTGDIAGWKYSSYNAMLSTKPTLITREFVINLFDDLENFKFCHLKDYDLKFE